MPHSREAVVLVDRSTLLLSEMTLLGAQECSPLLAAGE